jgi:hypothetical protein
MDPHQFSLSLPPFVCVGVVVFIGKVWLGPQIWCLNFILFLQILIFLYFDFFLKQAILTSTQTKKINNLENDELKSNVFKTPLKIKFF